MSSATRHSRIVNRRRRVGRTRQSFTVTAIVASSPIAQLCDGTRIGVVTMVERQVREQVAERLDAELGRVPGRGGPTPRAR